MKRFNELYRLVVTQPTISTDFLIMVDGKMVKEMTINDDNGCQVIELKTK